MTTRMFRGGDFERAPARSSDFDPIIEGQKYKLEPEVSLAIWERVRAELMDSDGVTDEPRAQQRFHQVAKRVAARRGQLGRAPGRVTRVEAEAWGADPDGDVFADLAPGRTTAMMDAERRTPGTETAPDRTRASLANTLGWDDTRSATLPGSLAVDAPRPGLAKDPTASRPYEMTPLDASVGARMSRLFGVDLTRVNVIPASPAATGATKAVTKDGEVHFRAGTYQPGTPDGDWLIAHELAHVVQQRGASGERAGTTTQLEREADRAATLATRDRVAPIALRAQSSAAYAFNEGEAHDADLDVVADHKVVHADASGGDGAKADAKADDRAEADHRATADHDETAGHGATAHAGHEDAATHADADHDASDTGGDEVSAVLPAQDSAADATTGGGGAAAKPQKAAPSLGATKPESGLGQLRGVRPDRIGLLFGQMHTAAALTKASADITAERAKETQAESQARTADDAQIHELKADADQVGAGRLPMAHEVARTIPQTDSAGDTRFDMSQPRNPAEREADADRFANAGLALSPHDLWSELGILHTTRGTAAVQAAVQALGPDPRIRFGALLGVDLSFVRFERGAAADQLLDEIDADGAAIGATVYLRASLGAERAWELEAHELTHVAQTGGGTSELGNDLEVAPPESAVEQEAEAVGQQLAAFQPLARPLAQSAPAGTVLRGKGKIIGWLVKVGERKLVKTVAIYSEKELAKLLGKGFNVLVRDGRQVAKRIAKKVWGDETLHHTGHIIRKTGKLGLSHFQPLRHGVGRAGEKGWHIFYSALPILFFSEDVDAMVIYEDKYPGKSVANYLTVTQYAGKDSWLSYLDWVNPLELIAIGGDLGRDWDRERTKELKALIFTRQGPNGTIQTYELDPEGQLVKVYVQGPSGEKKEFTAQEYHELLGKAVDGVAVENEPPVADGTTDPNYAGTFDAEYRIYHSKQGWNWVPKTLSFFLPAESAAKLSRVGSFYVNYDASIEYLYVFIHPSMRSALHQPGFKIPPDLIESYFVTPDKEQFLQNMLTSAVTSEMMKNFDPSTAK